MMKFFLDNEQKLLDEVLKNNPALAGSLSEAIKKVYHHLPETLISAKYDKKLVEEFLRNLLKDSQKLGVEKYFSIVTEDDTVHTIEKRCLAPNELQENILKSLGSFGLTKLLRDLLQKMAQGKFSEKEIENFVQLAEARNQLRQAEEKFLNSAFKAYLQKQISLYS